MTRGSNVELLEGIALCMDNATHLHFDAALVHRGQSWWLFLSWLVLLYLDLPYILRIDMRIHIFVIGFMSVLILYVGLFLRDLAVLIQIEFARRLLFIGHSVDGWV